MLPYNFLQHSLWGKTCHLSSLVLFPSLLSRVMEVVEEWEGEEESGGLKVRSRKGKMENPEAEKGAVQVEELGDSESCVYLDKDKGEFRHFFLPPLFPSFSFLREMTVVRQGWSQKVENFGWFFKDFGGPKAEYFNFLRDEIRGVFENFWGSNVK